MTDIIMPKNVYHAKNQLICVELRTDTEKVLYHMQFPNYVGAEYAIDQPSRFRWVFRRGKSSNISRDVVDTVLTMERDEIHFRKIFMVVDGEIVDEYIVNEARPLSISTLYTRYGDGFGVVLYN